MQSHPLRRVVPPADLSGRCWRLSVPSSFAPRPRYQIGQVIKLPKEYQITKGTVYYGLVVGLNYWRFVNSADNLWQVTIELPDEHPKAEFWDWEVIVREDELIQQRC